MNVKRWQPEPSVTEDGIDIPVLVEDENGQYVDVADYDALLREIDDAQMYQDAAMNEYFKALGFDDEYDRKCSTIVLGIKALQRRLDAAVKRLDKATDILTALEHDDLADYPKHIDTLIKKWLASEPSAQ